jgi:DUF971 family protein
MTPATTPLRLDLQKKSHLAIDWQDGRKSVFPISVLRTMCPCATCKQQRQEQAAAPKGRLSLRVLHGTAEEALSAVSAELVGGYALRIDWSDGHSSGIYSFEYLRSIDRDPSGA